MSEIKLVCSRCGYEREMAASALPQRRVTATCPKCKHSFDFNPTPPRPQPAATVGKPQPQPGENHVRLEGGMDNKRNKVFLFLFVALVVITVVVRLWADAQFKAVPYPNLMAASAEGVAVSCGRTIYVYAKDGRLLHSYDLPKEVEVTQLFWDNGVLCLADIRSKTVLELKPQGIRARSFTGATTSVQFKVAREPNTERLFVSDSAGHRILVFDRGGKFLNSFGREGMNAGEFRFPNEIAFDEAGQLLIANTKRPAIEVYTPEGQYKETLVTPARGTFCYPTDFIVTPDRLIVMENDGFLEKAMVRIYDRKGVRSGEMALGDTKVIGDLVADGERMYLTDCINRKLLAFSLGDLRPVGPFSGDFDSKCARWNKEAGLFRTISVGALAALFLFCGPIIFLYSRIKRAESKEVSKVDLSVISTSKGASTTGAAPAEIFLSAPVNRLHLKIGFALVGTGVASVLLSALFSMLALPHLFRLLALVCGTIATLAGVIALMRSGGIADFRRKQTETIFKRIVHDGMLTLLPDEQVERVALSQYGESGQSLVLLVFTDRRLLLHYLNWNKIASIEQVPYEAITTVKPPSGGSLGLVQTMRVEAMAEGQKQELRYFYYKADFLKLLAEEFTRRIGRVSGLPYTTLCLTCRQPLHGEYCSTCATKLTPDRHAMWLSLLFPGLGQIRNGELQKGLAFAIMSVICLLVGYLGIKGWLFEGADLSLKEKYNLVVLVIMAPLCYIANVVDAYRSSIKGRKPC